MGWPTYISVAEAESQSESPHNDVGPYGREAHLRLPCVSVHRILVALLSMLVLVFSSILLLRPSCVEQ